MSINCPSWTQAPEQPLLLPYIISRKSDEQQGYNFECRGINMKAQLLFHPVSLLHPLWFLPFSAALEGSRPLATDDLFYLPEDPRYET